MIEEMIEEIREAIPQMSPQQQKVGKYICEHPEALGVLSLSEFAEKTGISGPTVTRFCRSMGYAGFLEFTRRMHGLREKQISHAGYFHNARVMNRKNTMPGALGSMLLEADLANIRKLQENYPAEKLAAVVELMNKSSAIAVIGKMSAYPAAVYFEQLLSKITARLQPMTGSDVLQAAALSRLNANSVVFCLAFPRFPKTTLELAREASQKGAAVIGISNDECSPLAGFCHHLFCVDVDIFSYIDLFGAVFALINVICLEFSHTQSGVSEKSLADYDKVVENVYFVPGRKNRPKKS